MFSNGHDKYDSCDSGTSPSLKSCHCVKPRRARTLLAACQPAGPRTGSPSRPDTCHMVMFESYH